MAVDVIAQQVAEANNTISHVDANTLNTKN